MNRHGIPKGSPNEFRFEKIRDQDEIELKKHRVANWRKQVEKQTLLSSNFTRETYYSLSHFHDPNLDAVKENINGVCKFLE